MIDSPPRPKTHYEVLKVEADVSADDLRTAYRALSRRYHPDRHPKHVDAAVRIMAAINVAYDVLSDPERRLRYDRDIGVAPTRVLVRRPGRPTRSARHPFMPGAARGADAAFGPAGVMASDPALQRRVLAVRRLTALSVISCMAGVLIILWILLAPAQVQDEPDLARIIDARHRRATEGGGTREAARSAAPARQPPADVYGTVHIRPLESPLGLPWPSASGELPGYARSFATGQLGLLLDNRLGPADVFVKVYRVDEEVLLPGRHAFVRARERLLLEAFPPGTYEVHYLSLETGQTLRSLPLPLLLPVQVLGGAALEFRLDDMQGRSGRARPIPRDVFDTPVAPPSS